MAERKRKPKADSNYGYKANSLRTTLSNMKKKDAIVQGEDGVYTHPEDMG